MKKLVWAIAMSIVAIGGSWTAPPPAAAAHPCHEHTCHESPECRPECNGGCNVIIGRCIART